MSFKTIAVDSRVHEKLLRQKRESESFTKAIDRLVESAASHATCSSALDAAATIFRTPLTDAELDILNHVVEENRLQTNWEKDSGS